MKFATLTPEEKALKAALLQKERRRVVKGVRNMIRILISSGDTASAGKMKGALVQMEVAYNRAMLKLTGEANKRK